MSKFRAEQAVEEQPALGLVLELCEALEAEGVVYCHWKGTAALDRVATGDKDLDLLVGRTSVQRFTEVLYRLGFKEALGPSEKQVPSIQDFYGYDREADRLVHVHAHYQLIMGHAMTNNYHLPLESPYLASAVRGAVFNVPAPDFEFMLFVFRMVLKHSTWDAILGRQGTLSAAKRQELDHLGARASRAKVYNLLEQHLPFVDAALFEDCLRSLRPQCKMWLRIRAGQQLQNRLEAHARRLPTSDLFLKLWRRAVRAVRWRVFKRGSKKKKMTSGGAMVAIVGGDGAGKTTAVNQLYAWLSKDFEAIKVHMGKPDWSWTTITVRAILKIGQLLGLYPHMRSSGQHTLDTDSLAFPGYPWLLRQVCTARDRYLTYTEARRFATDGGVVICDRFPLPQVKSMDGRQAERRTSSRQNHWLVRSLVKMEKRYYRQIMLPELLIVLRADPDTTVQRKTDEDPASVRARSAEIWELDWQQTPACVVDADRPQEEVISELKALLWSVL